MSTLNLDVLGDLFALLPGQRPPQVLGKPLDGCGERVTDSFGSVPIGEGEQHHIPGPAFHQGADRGLTASR